MNDTASAAALHRSAQKTGLASSWPSIVVALLVVGGAVYSFSPRPKPQFPVTQVYADRLLVTSIARQGERLIAVGEQGQILIADAAQGPWRSAQLDKQRGSTFTRARFVGDGVALAVGHDGWIVRSADGGETWNEVFFGGDGSDPLLGLAGPYEGRLFAFGAFGLFAVSDDAGQTWQKRELAIEEDAAAETAPAFDPFADPNADPFANFDTGALGGTGHLNDMTQAADGSLILVGERGLLLRSTDKGENWKSLPEIYAGSLFGVMTLPSKTLVAFGMRGHAFRSEDNGQTWQEAKVPTATSLFGGTVGAQGQVLLGGAGNTVLSSTDDGKTYTLLTRSAGNTIAALQVLPDDGWLSGGDNGLVVSNASGASAAGDAS